MKAIVNAKAVLPGRVLENATLLLDGELIYAVGTNLEIPADAEVLDVGGMWVGPGFVDIHLHGDGKNSRWEWDPVPVAVYHLRHGSTTTVAYLPYQMNKQVLLETTKMVQQKLDEGLCPNVWAIGYEGPFINPNHGANSRAAIRPGTDPDEYVPLYEACHGKIAQWMYAPEMDPTGQFGNFLREKGVTAAVGHTAASPQQVRDAVDRGATVATHLFDAMGCHLGNDTVNVTGIIQDTAAVGCLICPEMTYEIIPDSKGIHVKASNIKLTYQLAGPQRVAIITDCAYCDYNPEDYPPEHFRSTVDLNYNEMEELSGSLLTMDQAIRNFQKHTGAPVVDLFQMAATTPARAIHADHVLGSIVPGKLANLVVLDENLQLQKVIFRGEEVEQ